MRNRRTTGLVAALAVSSVLTAACGLKPEVKDALATNPGFAAGAGAGQVAVDTDGDGVVDSVTTDPGAVGGEVGTVDPVTGQPTGTGSTGTGSTGTGSTGTGTTGTGTTGTGTTGTGTTAPGAAPAPGDDGTTTGIDFEAKTVKIALHGPLTGAGVPQESFRSGTPKYWNGRKLANGFTVIAEAIDDKYNAQDALRACNAAAKEYFLIVGGAGTDQIQACAQSQVLQRGNVPYLSAGVTESGLGQLPNYFATSLTYKQQGPLVVKAAQENGYFNGKWAIIITEGPNFDDARSSIVSALQAAKAQFNPSSDVYLTDKAPTNCEALAGQIRAGGYSTIYFLGQPAFYAMCVRAIGSGPTYTGPGPSFGINTVANLACSGTANGYKGFYLHPATGLDQAGQRAPGVSFTDDIEYQIYGAMQGLEKAFNLVQGKLTREKFIAALRQSEIPDGIAPGAVYKGGARFGGKAAFLLKASCGGTPQTNRYQTVKQYNK